MQTDRTVLATSRERLRYHVSATGVVGELLLTVGVVVLLYVVWQMWIGDLIYGAEASADGKSLSEDWDRRYEDVEILDPAATSPPVQSFAVPPVLTQPADAATFALMRIPRFGADYYFDIAGGTSRSRTLDTVRIGHYTDAAMPGEVGNFALAGHRTTFGAPFNRLADLRVGDAVVIEVPDGWYTYRFRNMEYVRPTEVEVLADVPQQPDVPPNERYITMTSCSPIGALTERIISYGVFDEFTPRSEGPPNSLATPS